MNSTTPTEEMAATEAQESKTNKHKAMEITCKDGAVLRANDGSRYVIFEKLLTSTNPNYHGENGYYFKPRAVWERDTNKLFLTFHESLNTADYEEVEGIEADFVKKSLDKWNEAEGYEAAVEVIKKRLKAKETKLETRERKLVKQFGDVEPGIQLVVAAEQKINDFIGNLQWIRTATDADRVKIGAVESAVRIDLGDAVKEIHKWILSIRTASRRANKDNGETNTEDTTNTTEQQ